MKTLISSLLIIIFTSISLTAQKKSIKVTDYSRFRSISRSVAISEKGSWSGFTYVSPRDNDTLMIINLDSGKEYIIPNASEIQFSDNEKWAAYKINLPFKKQESLKKEKKPLTVKAGLINLETGGKEEFDNISSLTFTKGSAFLIVQLAKTDPKAKTNGKDLIIKDLSSGHVVRYGDVSFFTVNKPGSMIAFTIEAPDTIGNGVFLLYSDNGINKPLETQKAIYSRPTWNENGTVVAVLKGSTPKGKTYRQNSLLAFTELETEFKKFVYHPSTDSTFPEDFIISENRDPGFSDDLSVYFFGIRKQDNKVEKKKDAPAIANVDIWHWNDERLQSVQMIRASRDKRFTYLSAVKTKEKKFVKIADSTMRNADISRNGKWVIGRNDKPYISDYKVSLSDYYRVDPGTGERKEILKGHERHIGFSPDSKHFLFWKDGNYWSYDLSTAVILNLTSNTDAIFTNEQFDRGGPKPPHGVAGWTKDGNHIILYTRYDLWLVPLDGGPGKNITNAYGTENEIRLRYVQTDSDKKFIDLNENLLLTAFGQWTKKAGFFKLEDNKLNKLVFTDNYYGRIIKAKKGDRYLFTREAPNEYGDLYFADLDFKKLEKISDTNPIVNEYNWYHNELIEYTNKDGVRLQAVLMIPDSYKKGEKYPMLVDFYEKNSHNLNRWSRIISRDTPMFPKYASNGYLVLLPDVHFNIGATHSNHLECVEAAVQKVIELGYADPAKIGLHGHSFSGQGGNYIVTHSDLFACAIIGAGASNLVSDFNQLWKSSGTNQHRYNYLGQGRFGTNPFDDLELYIDQSAVYQARDMNTPLMLFHGTADGSVEWLQAIEFYNALRFNKKNVILCSYPGEGHHLSKYENQVDFQTRMEQFYDHYLKGAKAPEWMIKGIPFLEKAANKK